MGCDIHAYLERKVEDKWVMVKQVGFHKYDPGNFCNRDYNYFAALAGVRGGGPEAKGLPDDVSDSVQMHSNDWNTDGHSHSYMPISEAIALYKFIHSEAPKYDDWVYHLFGEETEIIEEYRGGIKSYRVVFWFDN